MSQQSTDFEKKIYRIKKLIEGLNAEVTWNDSIKDPHNTKQSRQIDITVKKNGILIIIECRIHKSKQNVKWIEELYGRKISLHANKIIGVSSSGFYKTSIIKASALGVELRDIRDLNESEIPKWFNTSKSILRFYEIKKLEFIFHTETTNHLETTTKDIFIEANKEGFIYNFLERLRRDFDNSQKVEVLKPIEIDISIGFRYFFLFNQKVIKAQITGIIIPYEKEVPIKITEGYGEAGKKKREIFIENFEDNYLEIIKSITKATLKLNFKHLKIPSNTLISELITIDFGNLTELGNLFLDDLPVIDLNINNIECAIVSTMPE
jgi:hypothetical protein